MPTIYLETFIDASPNIVFDLSRSVDLHKASMHHHNEQIIDGVKNGLMNKGDTVTWKATHFFKMRTLKVQLTEVRHQFFVDEMIEGDFKKMRHEHEFKSVAQGIIMIDRFYFETPFGIFGRLINFLFLKSYMTRLLQERNNVVKKVAESNKQHQFLHA